MIHTLKTIMEKVDDRQKQMHNVNRKMANRKESSENSRNPTNENRKCYLLAYW